MPELPEVEALAEHLRTHALARPVARVDLASMTALKTFDPPLSALTGRLVTGASSEPASPTWSRSSRLSTLPAADTGSASATCRARSRW